MRFPPRFFFFISTGTVIVRDRREPWDQEHSRSRRAPVRSDEAALLRQCQRGSRTAFQELVLIYGERAFWAAYSLLGNYDDAQEFQKENRVFAALAQQSEGVPLSRDLLFEINERLEGVHPLPVFSWRWFTGAAFAFAVCAASIGLGLHDQPIVPLRRLPTRGGASFIWKS